MRTFDLTVGRVIASYCLFISLCLGFADYWYARNFFPPLQPTSYGTTTLLNRLAWYKEHTADYNLIFLGDSKTYCGIHPELLDPLLGTSSLNLSVFTNWFPTQLALAQDIAPMIPKGTTVVWSIGAINFMRPTVVQRVYPVGIENALRYLYWGLARDGLADNIQYYNPALHFVSRRDEVRQAFVNFLDQQFRSVAFAGHFVAHPSAFEDAARSAPVSDFLADEDANQLKASYEKSPGVAQVVVIKDNGKVTSLVVYFKRGSYYRVEIDPSYFRRKQKEWFFSKRQVVVDPALWRLFEEILQKFKTSGVKLIVNELEDAPLMYGAHDWQVVERRWMRDVVRKKVTELGFHFTNIDFDKLTDSEYFDYNHLNSRGAEIFSPLLAEQLRPYLNNSASSPIQPIGTH